MRINPCYELDINGQFTHDDLCQILHDHECTLSDYLTWVDSLFSEPEVYRNPEVLLEFLNDFPPCP